VAKVARTVAVPSTGHTKRDSQMFDVIVVGTDGSEPAGVAVHHATALAALMGGTLHVVCSYRPVSQGGVTLAASGGVATPDVEQVNQTAAVQAEKVCEHTASEAARQGVSVGIHAVPGEPADVLVGVANDVGADLLVVGSRGMTGVRRFVLGSVPNKVSHHCPCSLLIVDTRID
jgi:nucleotide-binding universal stress UspA family protein